MDNENGNDLWWKAIAQEMKKNVRPAFEICEGNVKDLIGCQKTRYHVTFDIKLGEGFRCEARLVAGGHVTDAPASIAHSSVVSCDSVCIALTMAALNSLDTLACNTQNVHSMADCREKVHTVAGPEFASEQGSVMLVEKVLCGLKLSGAAFRSHLAKAIWDLGH